MAPELWTIEKVAEYIGASSTGSARRYLSRWGVAAHDYQPSANGRPQARYRADAVRAAHQQRPGQGARTDLHAAIHAETGAHARDEC